MKEIRARLVQETVMLSKLALITQEAGNAAHAAGDEALQHRLESIDWLVQKAVRILIDATGFTQGDES